MISSYYFSSHLAQFNFFYYFQLKILIDVWYLALRSISPFKFDSNLFLWFEKSISQSKYIWKDDRERPEFPPESEVLSCQENYHAPFHKFIVFFIHFQRSQFHIFVLYGIVFQLANFFCSKSYRFLLLFYREYILLKHLNVYLRKSVKISDGVNFIDYLYVLWNNIEFYRFMEILRFSFTDY